MARATLTLLFAAALAGAGCTLGTGCPYDGGSHTEPVYYVSSLLIAYR